MATEEPEREPDYSSDESGVEQDETTCGVTQHQASDEAKEELQEHYVMLPPPYGDNNDLPTYEEVERIKIEEEARVCSIHIAFLFIQFASTVCITVRSFGSNSMYFVFFSKLCLFLQLSILI